MLTYLLRLHYSTTLQFVSFNISENYARLLMNTLNERDIGILYYMIDDFADANSIRSLIHEAYTTFLDSGLLFCTICGHNCTDAVLRQVILG